MVNHLERENSEEDTQVLWNKSEWLSFRYNKFEIYYMPVRHKTTQVNSCKDAFKRN